MNGLRYTLLIIFFALTNLLSLVSQDCIDYGTFDDPPCGNCAPTGWQVGPVFGPEMTNAPHGCSSTGPSPSGGTFVDLDGNSSGSGSWESINTTINGLVPGQTYILVFWYMSPICPPYGPMSLEIYVDGEVYDFQHENEWTLAEICFEASSTSAFIELQSILDSGNNGTLHIDDASCADAEAECCPLELELPEEEEVCPNQAVELYGEVTGEFGPLIIEWFCDPPVGLDYLSSTSILNPIFQFPNTDPFYGGQTFDFELVVSDNNCTISEEIEVTVLPVTIPEFTFDERYCETDGFIDLPTVSENGFTGIWQMQINTFDWPGEIVTNLFIPDQWQVGCPIETPFEFVIEEFLTPEFDFPLEWCRSKVESFEFPLTSINEVDGEWNVPAFIPDDYSDGIIDFIFTPYDLFCSETVIVEIELTSGDNLVFDLPGSYCTDQEFIMLPEESIDGIAGTWSEPTVDIRLSGSYMVTFTPIDEDCYAVYEYAFEVTNALSVTLDTLSPICRTNGPVLLDSLVPEGFLGYWSQPAFDPDTIQSNQFISTWTPLPGQSPCLSDSTVTFIIEDPFELEFDLPVALCVSDSIFDLPQNSINGNVEGSWSTPSIDPSIDGVGVIQTLFTPADSSCALPFMGEIEIIDFLLPDFSFPQTVCELDPAFNLTNVSDNGIQGTWSIPTINPTGSAGQIIESVFTPDSAEDCISPIITQIEIQSANNPQFDLPQYLCWTETEFILENISDNGYTGSWNINPVNISDYLGQDLLIEFTPDPNQCVDLYTTNIQIVDVYNTISTETNPTSCTESDGKIELLGDIIGLEFSIDNGNNWQRDPCFENLGGGNFVIQVRSLSYPDCILEIYSELEAPGSPEILSVLSNPVSGCDTEDGSIVINASGTNLEYSIDNGVNWSSNNSFTGLGPGLYSIVVREVGVTDCDTESSTEIEDFPKTLISSVMEENLSDCNSNDGEIDIRASGQNLEYSIDNGLTWSDNNLFQNLPEGDYSIVVRSKDDLDCIDQLDIALTSPEPPTIENIDVIHPGNCDPGAGELRIIAQGIELEYSIDGGITWQSDPTFTNLTFGLYDISIRETAYPNCLDSDQIELIEEIQMLQDVVVNSTPLSLCDANDAQITIASSNPDIEVSIDQGTTWQAGLLFDNLGPGIYEIIVRHIININCQISFEIEIANVPCPCGSLEVEFDITPMYCVDIANGAVNILDIQGSEDPDIEIIWDNGETGPSIDNLSGGWYPFTVFYDDCEWTDSAFVEQIDPLNFALTTFDPNCPGGTDGTIEITEISGGNGNYTYSIDGVEYQASNVFVNLEAAEYQVFVLDEQNCLQSQFVNLISDEAIQIDLPQIMTIQQGETVFLNPLINEETIDSFAWDQHPTILNPDELIAQVAPQETTSYTLSIFYGLCIEIRIVTVEVIESEEIYVPNIFSPSSQDINSTFFLQSDHESNIEVLNLHIYDRWGNLMFHNDNVRLNEPNDGWNGYYNEYKVQPGVYVYLVEYVKNGKVLNMAGTITLY